MGETSAYHIGEVLQSSGRLSFRPLCIYSGKFIPLGAIPAPLIDRCIIQALIKMMKNKSINSIYLDEKSSRNLCPGGRGWLGYRPISASIKYFVSTGKPSKEPSSKGERKSFSECYLNSPETAEDVIKQIGKINALPEYLTISPCEQLDGENVDAKAILCYGTAEQIRNLSALGHFRGQDIYHNVIMPFGSACTTLITFPAEMAEFGPRNAIFVGPVDPTINHVIDPNYLFIAIPFQKAVEMASDSGSSFLNRHTSVAFPKHRLS